MAETDILNPDESQWIAIGGNASPNYGWSRKTASNNLLTRSRGGAWASRDNANAGYSFPLTYTARPLATSERLKRFYEIGKRGYFTIIDWDGGERHHVGRFTNTPDPINVAYGCYSFQNLIFEEIPQSRMLSYPADFTRWGSQINVLDDSLTLNPAARGSWTLRQNPSLISPSVTDPSSYQLWSSAPIANDFAQIEYVGWGFQATFNVNAVGGQCNVYLDGQLIVEVLDFFSGNCNASHGYSFINPLTPFSPLVIPPTAAAVVTHNFTTSTVTVTMTGVPLDIHRLKVVALNTKNASSAGFEVTFPNVKVIV